jgi:hypothetical protein
MQPSECAHRGGRRGRERTRVGRAVKLDLGWRWRSAVGTETLRAQHRWWPRRLGRARQSPELRLLWLLDRWLGKEQLGELAFVDLGGTLCLAQREVVHAHLGGLQLPCADPDLLRSLAQRVADRLARPAEHLGIDVREGGWWPRK